jgi:hypothetical protein
VDFSFTLPDGDSYLVYGSLTSTNASNGAESNTYDFQITYEGNSTGGPSAADTITVERYAAFQASLSSQSFYTSFIGAFSSGIVASRSASSNTVHLMILIRLAKATCRVGWRLRGRKG